MSNSTVQSVVSTARLAELEGQSRILKANKTENTKLIKLLRGLASRW